nr:adenylylsulfatase hint3 [Quercus suber]
MTSVGSEGTECDTVGSESESATSSMVLRVPVGAMLESVGAEYCLFGDRLWDDHIAVLLIHELGHLIRKPQKGICIILTHTVALVQQHMGLGKSLDSFNLVVNNGASAGQVIFHTHIHIIPRKAHDCLWPSELYACCLGSEPSAYMLEKIRRQEKKMATRYSKDKYARIRDLKNEPLAKLTSDSKKRKFGDEKVDAAPSTTVNVAPPSPTPSLEVTAITPPITRLKGKSKIGMSVWDDPVTALGHAHNVITSDELKGLLFIPSHELVNRHIHKLVQASNFAFVLRESLRITTDYLNTKEKVVVATSKAKSVEVECSQLKKDLITAMNERNEILHQIVIARYRLSSVLCGIFSLAITRAVGFLVTPATTPPMMRSVAALWTGSSFRPFILPH